MRFGVCAAAAFLFAALTACAPTIKSPGPTVEAPQIAPDAFTATDGTHLPLRRWLPEGKPKAVILGLHGFNDYSNAFEDSGVYLRGKGVATFAYDQRGFGASPNTGYWAGTEAYIDDLRAATTALRAAYPDTPLFVMGESMGGAVAMAAFGGNNPPPADGTILLAPAVWGRETMDITKTVALWVSVRTVPWMRLSGEGLDIVPSDNKEMLRKLFRDPLVIKKTRVDAIWGLVNLMDLALENARTFGPPSLILYGEKDEIIPKGPTKQMLERLPPVPPGTRRVAIYSNGYHMLSRDLEARVVLDDIAVWVSAHSRGADLPLPSGADKRGWDVLDKPDKKGG